MKRTLLLAVLAIFSSSLIAQQNAIDTYFKAHLGNPAFEKFEVTQRTFELLLDIETDDTDEQRVLEALANIEGIKVLANDKTEIAGEYYQEAMDKLLPDEAYQDLVVLENENHNIRFLIRETEEAIQEFVAVIGDKNDFVVASLYGTIDIASLSRIMEVMRNGGGKWLNSLHNMHEEEIHINKQQPTKNPTNATLSPIRIQDLRLNIYPNPATDFINVETATGTSAKMQIGFYTLLGKEVKDLGKVELPYKVDLRQLPSGTYFLRLTDEEGTFKNFKVINY